jgi:hypothetical protein
LLQWRPRLVGLLTTLVLAALALGGGWVDYAFTYLDW